MLILTLRGSYSTNHLLARVLSFVYLEQRGIRIRGSPVPRRAMLGHSPGEGQLSLYRHVNEHDNATESK
jgi:hypothetical protein